MTRPSRQARSFEVKRGRWIWMHRVPYIPDVGADVDRVDVVNLLHGFHALAESIARESIGDCVVQIRLLAAEGEIGAPTAVVPVIVGRGESLAVAERIERLVRATLPAEVPLDPVSSSVELRVLLRHGLADEATTGQVVEIRRRVDEAGAEPAIILEDEPALPAVLRWSADDGGLRHAASVLAQQGSEAAILLHMEPAEPTAELLDHLQSILRDVARDGDAGTNPLRFAIAKEYRQRLRDLPRASLRLRVAIASHREIAPGLAEAVGMALTAQEGYAIATPSGPRERIRAEELFLDLRAPEWDPHEVPEIAELQSIADTYEAATVVRLPSPLRGGTIGLPSRPVSTLPRAAEPARRREELGVTVGDAHGGGRARLSLDELNRHLLVAGLPGFGKTVTTQSILARLWHEHRVPFLVIDPAKSDYDRLVAHLRAGTEHGTGAGRGENEPLIRRISLGPDAVAFNPFGVPPGVSTSAHASRVIAAFDAAFSFSVHWPLAYITLGRAVFLAYENSEEGPPTLRVVESTLRELIGGSDFRGDAKANLLASLLGRLEYLRRGPLGTALDGDAHEVLDYEELLRSPAVIELRGFSGSLERSLVFALLLAGAISYREAHPVHGRLGHVIVLEEAHRVLSTSGTGASEGVRLFVEAIAELRGSGQGFMVVDQAPTQLDPGVLKLSGSILTHRLVELDERTVIGSALLLDQRQSEDLARLDRGEVVLHSSSRSVGVVVDVQPVPELVDGVDLRVALNPPPWMPVRDSPGRVTWTSADEVFEQLLARGDDPTTMVAEGLRALLLRRNDDIAAAVEDYAAFHLLIREHRRGRRTSSTETT
ncbi:DUF87 domain-containing protein [Rathayibacter sp. VKM Ac-2804]|uniref:ATP-binding protein n=1 Tax=Rathayibacter sp. VKM Ac-2804 TaxID=2609257 RepID=UPI00132F49C5|nr:DUF87 domain-containing protein [Rathayibacter sp. VKM Ac-2804]QHF22724.1 DUF87 domain-containing protein [Rathayibacter sp. VKM Ac-2804]